MPQTESVNGPSLGIRLDRDQPAFTLPDTITGHLYCSTHIVTSKAVVTVALVGRSKSRMVVRHGSWGRTYRGRFTLVDESRYTHKLYEAPLHIPVDGEEKTWPFTIILPTHFDAIKTASDTTQDESYLSLTNEPATYSLPPSFVTQDWGYGEGMECYVEYFLRAELTTTNRGSTNIEQATQLLTITTLYHGPMQRGARWQTLQHPCTLKRTEAVRGQARTQSMGSSTTARSTEIGQTNADFIVLVKTPALIQLSHSDPISFLLQAEPLSPLLSDGSLMSSYEVLLTEIAVTFVASTSVKCRGRRKARDANGETKFRLSDKATNREQLPMLIPWTEHSQPDSSGAHNSDVASSDRQPSQALDVGLHLGLRLPHDRGISESFTTHNIHHTHRLDWKMTIQIAGQTSSLSGTNSVELIAPSSHDVPIDYETLQREVTRERALSVISDAMPPDYAREQPLPPRPPRETGGVFGLSRLWDGV